MTTDYVVLSKGPGPDDLWGITGPDIVRARSAKAAISAVVEKRGDSSHGSAFVAVPARSWKPVKVSVETKTSLRFS